METKSLLNNKWQRTGWAIAVLFFLFMAVAMAPLGYEVNENRRLLDAAWSILAIVCFAFSVIKFTRTFIILAALCSIARADTPISGLPAATSVNASDVVPIVQTGTTKKASFTIQKDLWDSYYVPLTRTVTIGGNILTLSTNVSVTASEILDQISSTQGTILYRGASNWTALATGTDGFQLTTHGAAANPTWTAASGTSISDTAYGSSWNGVTTVAPSKNAVYDWGHTFDTDDDGKVNVLDMGAGLVLTDAGGVVSIATEGTDYLGIARIDDTAFGVGWNGDTTHAPSKNAVYDQLNLALTGSNISDTAFASSWNGVTTIAPSKNAVYDWGHTFDTDDDGKVNVLDMGAGIVKTDAGGVASAASEGTDYLGPARIDDSAFGLGWDADTTHSASKNALYDKFTALVTGAGSSTDGNIAQFSGSTGHVLQDTGLAAPSGAIVGTSDTQTLTNKRITSRSGTASAPGATPTLNTDNYDVYTFTSVGADITSMTTNLSGTPVTGDKILLGFKDNGTARGITWGASFQSGPATLLATTVISKQHWVGLMYDGSKWTCMAVDATGY